MTKKNYFVLGIILAVAQIVGQVFLSRYWLSFDDTKLLLGVGCIVAIGQIICHVVIYKKDHLKIIGSVVGVALFFAFAFTFIGIDLMHHGGTLPSGSTVFLWIPQAWIFKTLVNFREMK